MSSTLFRRRVAAPPPSPADSPLPVRASSAPRLLWPALALLLAAGPLAARPIAYAGATTVMADAGGDTRELMAFHAPAYWWSAGAGWHRYEGEDARDTRELAYARGNLLLKRWNLPRAQANAFAWGSLGRATGPQVDGGETASNAGFQLDYETLRIYVMAKTEWWHADSFTHRMSTAQLGVAPYAHRYGGWATWLVGMVEDKGGGLGGAPEYTLLLRFFNETTWIEAGVDEDGDARLMLMLNF